MRSAAAALFALSVAAAPALAAPARVVSIHLCADQLVVALADRVQIASVSWHAADPAQSFVADRAADLPQNYGRAEEVLALHPDLVLAGAYSGRETKALLRRLGVTVIDLDLPRSFADIRRQTLAVADALGHPERGRTLTAEMDAKLAEAQRAVGGLPAAAAILLQPGGVTMGRGFLEDEILRAAGLDNVATRLGIVGQGTVSMERLIAAKPNLIVLGLEPDAPPSLSSRMITNPALTRATGARIVSLPPILWTCGGWFTADAVDRLADARRAIAAQ
jgi:iron complex transport system substrate-binding protein